MNKILFSSKSQEYSEFSNFYKSPFIVNNKNGECYEWMTVEHYFQAMKFPTDILLQEKIRKCSSPIIAKRLGKTKTEHFRKDWEDVKEDIMLDSLRYKFNQNQQLLKLLKNTGNTILVENNIRDNYWGIGRNNKGKNRMGVLLSIIRTEL